MMQSEAEVQKYQIIYRFSRWSLIPDGLFQNIKEIAIQNSQTMTEEEKALIVEILNHKDLTGIEPWKLIKLKKTLVKANVLVEFDGDPELTFDKTFRLPSAFKEFSGRELELEQLKNHNKDPEISNLYQLSGTGGVGKSVLANHYARMMLEERYYHWVIWFRASSIGNESVRNLLLDQYVDLCEELKIDTKVYQGLRSVKIVYQELFKIGRGLVIFDDVQIYEEIREFLPSTYNQNKMDVLITTKDSVNLGSEIKKIHLGIFNPGEALRYIMTVMERNKFLEDDANLLAESLGFFPLALTQALAYINNNPLSIKEYIELFNRKKENQKRLLDYAPFKTDNHKVTILATVNLSIELLKNPHSLPLLQVCSYFAAESPIDVKLLKNWFNDEINFLSAIENLKNYSLIKDSSQFNHIDMHQIVQLIVTVNDTEETVIRQLMGLTIFIGRHFTTTQGVLKDNIRQQLCMSHVSKLISILAPYESTKEECKIALGSLRFFLGVIYIRLCQWEKAETEFSYSLSLAREQFDSNPYIVADCLMNLGGVYLKLGKPINAKDSSLEALALSSKVGLNSIGVQFQAATCYMHLGAANLMLNESENAIKNLKCALNLFGMIEHEHPDSAKCLLNLGALYMKLEEYEVARQYLNDGLSILIKHCGEEHVDVGGCRENLGEVEFNLKNYDNAKKMLEIALSIYENIFGKHNKYITGIKMYLGMSKIYLGDVEEGLKDLNDVRTILLFKRDSLSTADTLFLIGGHLLAAGIDNAEQFFRDAIDIREKLLGSDHLDTALCCYGLLGVFLKLKKLTEGYALLIKILPVFMRELGPNDSKTKHVITLISHSDMSSIRDNYIKTIGKNIDESLFDLILSNTIPINETSELRIVNRCIEMKFFDCALNLLSYVTFTDAKLVESLKLRTQCLIETHNFGEAEKTIGLLNNLPSVDANVTASLGDRLILSQLEHAKVEQAEQKFRVQPNLSIEGCIKHVILLEKNREYKKCEALLNTLKTKTSDNQLLGPIYYHLAVCYQELRWYDLALEAIEMSLRYSPHQKANDLKGKIEIEKNIYLKIVKVLKMCEMVFKSSNREKEENISISKK